MIIKQFMNPPTFTLHNIVSPPVKKDGLSVIRKKQDSNEGIILHQKGKGILLNSFICGVIGNPGSGKSTIIEQFIINSQFYGKRFQRVLFIGPTRYKKIIQDDHNTKTILDVSWIYEKILQANVWKCKSMLIILDDVVANLKSATNPDFIELFYNRRHLLQQGCISLLVSGQKWNMIPTFIRGAYNMVIIFPLAKSQLEIICRQMSVSIPKKILMDIFSNLRKHQFLYFNLDDCKIFNSQWTQL